MKKIKLFVKYTSSNVEFRFTNIHKDIIHILQDFAIRRGGFFRYDLKKFSIHRKLNKQQLLQIFECMGINAEIIEENTRGEEGMLQNQKILYGRYRGYRWSEIPYDYLKVLYEHDENKYAYAEIKRRKFEKSKAIENLIIGFGKYRGLRWLELPKDYLRWLIANIQNNKVAKLAQVALELQNIAV